jgi:hypothetical protein
VHAAVRRAGCDSVATDERLELIRPIVVAFAQYLDERADVCATAPGSEHAARPFWATLAPSTEAVATLRVAAALESLTTHSPHHVYPVTD